MFTKEDIKRMETRGIRPEAVERQLESFKKGFPFLQLDRPATIGDGIIRLDEREADEWAMYYDSEAPSMTVEKFVPASGAATRMFKDLFSFLEESPDTSLSLLYEKYPSVKEVVERISDFAFFPRIKQLFPGCNQITSTRDARKLISLIISEQGLDYGNLPKGLLDFHSYTDGARTSFGEHLAEAALYAKRDSGMAHVHFTVTPEHKPLFRKLLDQIRPLFEKRYKVKYDVSFSEQSPSTDTIAADMNNEPFRDKNGELVFRPAGHGALLHNLNRIESEIVFIKNIDNVVPESINRETIRYKKAIGGILINNVNAINEFLYRLDDEKNPASVIEEIREFYRQNFFFDIPENYSVEEIRNILDRPVRVCGMVKNQGEPGGGPFWVKQANGAPSLQIVESSQVEKNNAVFRQSTHFNPVDLVCFIYNYKGEKFQLNDFADPDTGFISIKSKDGRDLKAMELPGLWNGAMANWNTVFVEVPLITFNPVKTINDLLREEHRVGS